MSKKQGSIWFIFITILIDVIGVGMIYPNGPALLQEVTDKEIDELAVYYEILILSYACMQFLFSPLLGALSDKFGRRPILLLSLFGLCIDYILQIYAGSFIVLMIGRIIGGIFGASYTVASAYASDISTNENKSRNFGLIGAAFGLGFIIGPLLGGVISENFGVRAPFAVASILCGLNFIYGYFIL